MKPTLETAKMRILIAKDVIAGLKVGNLKAKEGTFLRTSSQILGKPNEITDQLKPVLKKVSRCNVCALGSIFVTAVKRYNDLLISEVTGGSHSVDSSSMRCHLKRFFSLEQMHLIEAAFEGFIYNKAADNFFQRFKKPEERMIAIMKNIIENNGTFKP